MLMTDHDEGKECEAELEADDVHDVAADRLQHDGALEGTDNPGILARRDPEIAMMVGAATASVLRVR